MSAQYVLASGSPRRIQLLTQLGLTFTAVPANIDETARPKERPQSLVRRLAATKAITGSRYYPDAVIIGSDTVVAQGRQIYGKPRDEAHAREVLRRLSGKRHQVYTGVAVYCAHSGRGYVDVVAAHVTFRPLTALEIADYVQSGEPMDKAGGYAIQGQASKWVVGFEGNLETVMGLPTDRVTRLIERIGSGGATS
ncbi:MAG: Maf family protein [Firmicutes bacterium]|nr:Maf family protein [Bacillota bacterium]